MNWSIFFEQVPDGDVAWWRMLAAGLAWTLATAVCAWVIAFGVGSVVGVARTTRWQWLVRLGNLYVEVFRNVPLIVQFFLWYFVVPGLVPALQTAVSNMDPTLFQFETAVVCLGLFTAARIAEQVRAGILSLARGQRLAAYALGLSEFQTYRHVLLPMAYRIIIPPLTSELMNLVKNTAVAYSIGLTELFFRTREMAEITFRYFEVFAVATLIYGATAFSANRLMAWVERRSAVPGYLGARR
jgi:glutamate/aspartate transport system permease protein